MPLVYDMLINSRVNIEAARILLLNASQAVDLKRGYELELERTENPSTEMRQKAKHYSSLAALLTPMSKYLSTEYANKVSYATTQCAASAEVDIDVVYNAGWFYGDGYGFSVGIATRVSNLEDNV